MKITVTSTMIGARKRFMAQLWLHGYWHAAFFGKTSMDAFGAAMDYVKANYAEDAIGRLPERVIN